MSVVVAIKTEKGILVGTDSQISCGGSKSTIYSPNLTKIWRTNHPNMIMGAVGALRVQNVLKAKQDWYDPIIDDAGYEMDFDFVVRELVPTIANELSSFGFAIDGGAMGLNLHSGVLVAKDTNCYHIDQDGCVVDLCYEGDMMAIGSGEAFAQAAYGALEGLDIDPKEKLYRCIKQACVHDLHVNYPIIMMSTYDNTYEIWDAEGKVYPEPKEEEEGVN